MEVINFVPLPELLADLQRDPMYAEQARRQSRYCLALQLLAWRTACPGQAADFLDMRAIVARARTQAADRFSTNAIGDAAPARMRHYGRGLYAALVKDSYQDLTAGIIDLDEDGLKAEITAIDRLEMLERYGRDKRLMNDIREHCRYNLARTLLDRRLSGAGPVLGPKGIERLASDALLDAADGFSRAFNLSSGGTEWSRWLDSHGIVTELAKPRLKEFTQDLFIKQEAALAFERAHAGIFVLNTDARHEVSLEKIESLAREGGEALLSARRAGWNWEEIEARPFIYDGLRVF